MSLLIKSIVLTFSASALTQVSAIKCTEMHPKFNAVCAGRSNGDVWKKGDMST
ncbi:hypothetical protein PGT21_010264 [Puccinia graminis f. sp. tritici]|uniref:Uncharacterized protein n=1 Tax=Puccinia graminis f. sp. tritici TaxID=56615 RepID=A0A5B0LPE0_PUCGR|nr:hypothetical protein PGT21_010264 [Puccinia graminis f. sp. tritici]KAA1132346.1 hypothetical protein PGTUg99_006155 [Puccinia graminis f. sp. tritici]